MLTLWKSLGAPARQRFMLALTLSALSGAAGVILLGLSGWFLTAAALAGASGAGFVFNHLYPSAGVRAAAFARVLCRYGEQLTGHDATLSLSARLRPAIFAGAARSGRGMTPTPAKDLSALIDDVDAAEAGFLRVMSPAAGVAASIFVALVFAFAAGAPVGFAAIAAFVLAGAVMPAHAVSKSRAAAADLAAKTEAARAEVASLVENAIELDVIGALPIAAEAARRSLDAQLSATDAIEAPFRTVGAIGTASGLLLAVFLLHRASTGETSLAIAVGAALSLLAAFDATAAMVKIFDAVSRARVASERLNARVRKVCAAWDAPGQIAVQIASVFPVELKALVAKAADNAPEIGPINLKIEPGALVEFVGPSGAGKTTLAETLMRLQPIAGGTIEYAGVDASRLRIASALERIALSPQFPAFLPGTLRDALMIGAPQADDAALWRALEIAAVDKAVAKIPMGLETPFAENAAEFSGGELRRIGLARAILAAPEILILDEPFAGIDAPLAGKIAENLRAWLDDGKRALIILAHEPVVFPFGREATLVNIGGNS